MRALFFALAFSVGSSAAQAQTQTQAQGLVIESRVQTGNHLLIAVRDEKNKTTCYVTEHAVWNTASSAVSCVKDRE